MFESYIVDELGDVVCKCSEYSEDEIMGMLMEHPEWERRCISTREMYY